MSLHYPSDFNEVRCGWCGARKGRPCKTKDGKTRLAHRDRKYRWLREVKEPVPFNPKA